MGHRLLAQTLGLHQWSWSISDRSSPNEGESSDLVSGVGQLHNGFTSFSSGLTAYTSGVGQLGVWFEPNG